MKSHPSEVSSIHVWRFCFSLQPQGLWSLHGTILMCIHMINGMQRWMIWWGDICGIKQGSESSWKFEISPQFVWWCFLKDFKFTTFFCCYPGIISCFSDIFLSLFRTVTDFWSRWGYTKIARDSSCWSEVNLMVLYQSSQGYASKYKGKIPAPGP